MEPILETEEAESSLRSSQTNSRPLRPLPLSAQFEELSRSLATIRAGLEVGDPKFGMSLQEAKEVYLRVEECVNLVMKQQGQVKNIEDREKKKTAELASSQQEIMNLKKQLSLVTQRLTEAEESVKESREKAVPPEEVEQLFMRLADFESLAHSLFDADALSDASATSIMGLTASKALSGPGSPYTPLEDKENVEVETNKLRRAVEEAEEEAKSAKQASVQALLEAEGYKEELEKANGMILSIKEELKAVRRATCREIRGLQMVQNVCETQHQELVKERQRSHAVAEELRRIKAEAVLNATIGKEAPSTGVPASKEEEVEALRRDDLSETTASSSSAEAVAIFREHVVDTQDLLDDEMANVNTVLDVQVEVLDALARVTQDRTDLRARLKTKQSETDQVRRELENAEARNEELKSQLQSKHRALQGALEDAMAMQSTFADSQAKITVELEAEKQQLEAQVAAVTEELRASEEKASLQNGELSGLLSKLQASHDDLQQQLQFAQEALQAQEQRKTSDDVAAAEAAQSLQAANAALQTKVDDLQSQVAAKQEELAALAETLQDSEAKATDAATQLLTAQLKAASEERESMESKLQSAQEAVQALQSQLEATRLQQAEAQSEVEAKKQELEAHVAALTEQLVATEEKASQQNMEMSGLLSAAQTLQASHDDLQQQLQFAQEALQEQHKVSDGGVAPAVQVQSEAACFDISTPQSSKSPWAESPEAVAGADQSGLLAENKLLRERLSAFEEEKATSLQALREQVMLLARENYDLKHGARQAEAPLVEAKEVPAGAGAASEGDQRWWLSAIFSPFLTEGDMREIHAQSRLDEADGRNEG